MTANERLIVALDTDTLRAGELFCWLNRELDLTWFKIGTQMLLQHSGMILIENMLRDGVNLFFDLKAYDTRDTITTIARRAFDLGARFLTVHATPSMLEAAMRTKTSADQRVLAVGSLTDAPFDKIDLWVPVYTDGLICNVAQADILRNTTAKLLVCPGIRPSGVGSDNHVRPSTPTQAIRAGADYLVIGRPITQALDPVAAARAIIAEMEAAQ